jgi:hypothetical protein
MRAGLCSRAGKRQGRRRSCDGHEAAPLPSVPKLSTSPSDAQRARPSESHHEVLQYTAQAERVRVLTEPSPLPSKHAPLGLSIVGQVVVRLSAPSSSARPTSML